MYILMERLILQTQNMTNNNLKKGGLPMRITTIFILGLILVSVVAFADVPQILNFQGQLKDSEGNAVSDGDYSIQFLIYTTETGGAAVWQQTQTVTVNNGIFNVLLSNVNLDFSSSAYYLAMKVGSDSEMSPRQRITSVMYAMNADKVDGIDGSEIVQSVNSQTPDENGNVEVQGTSIWQLNGDSIYYNDGNVGIGTESPSAQLHIYSSGTVARIRLSESKDESGDAYVEHLSVNEPYPDSRIALGWWNHPNKGWLQFLTGNGQSEPTIRMVVDENGKVGIGTATPQAKLEVAGAIKVPNSGTLIFGKTNETGTPTLDDGFRIRYDGSFFGQYGDALIFEKTDYNSDAPDGGIAFVNTGSSGETSTAMVIRGDGNVGIGTSEPEGKLDVKGFFYLTHSSLAPFRMYLGADASTANGAIFAHLGTANSGRKVRFIDYSGGSYHKDVLCLNMDNGNVALGTAHPQARFHVKTYGVLPDVLIEETKPNSAAQIHFKNTTRTWEIGGDSNPDGFYIHKAGGNQNYLFINPSGNVGIGTTSPSAKLHVNGNIKATGSDFAEPFNIVNKEDLELGDVVVIDSDNPKHVKKSTKAYDRTVAGIVSSEKQAGYIAGARSDGTSDKPIALVGQVICKVSTENGKIEIGDLLTTSNTPGYAMKATDFHKQQGAILGKALQNFDEDKGEILVLVSLQ